MAIKTDLDQVALSGQPARSAFQPVTIQDRAYSFAKTLGQLNSTIGQVVKTAEDLSARNARRAQEEFETEQRVKQESLKELKLKYDLQAQRERQEEARRKAQTEAAKDAADKARLEANNRAIMAKFNAEDPSIVGKKLIEAYQRGDEGAAMGYSEVLLGNAIESATIMTKANLTDNENLDDYDVNSDFSQNLEQALGAYGVDLKTLEVMSSYDSEGFNKQLNEAFGKLNDAKGTYIDKVVEKRKAQRQEALEMQVSARAQGVVADIVANPAESVDAIYNLNEELARNTKMPEPLRKQGMMNTFEILKERALNGEADITAEQYEAMMYSALRPQGNKAPSPLATEEEAKLQRWLGQIKAKSSEKVMTNNAQVSAVKTQIKYLQKTHANDPFALTEELEKLDEQLKGTLGEAEYAALQSPLTTAFENSRSSAMAIGDFQTKYAEYLQTPEDNLDDFEFNQRLQEDLENNSALSTKAFVDGVIKKDVNMDSLSPEFADNYNKLRGRTRDFGVSTEIYNPVNDFVASFEKAQVKDEASLDQLNQNLDTIYLSNPTLYREIVDKSPKLTRLSRLTSIMNVTGLGDKQTIIEEVFGRKTAQDKALEGTMAGDISRKSEQVTRAVMEGKVVTEEGMVWDTEAKFINNAQNVSILKEEAKAFFELTGGSLTPEEVQSALVEHLRRSQRIQPTENGVLILPQGHTQNIYSESMNRKVNDPDNVKSMVYDVVLSQQGSASAIKGMETLLNTYEDFSIRPGRNGLQEVYVTRDGVTRPLVDTTGSIVRFKAADTPKIYLRSKDTRKVLQGEKTIPYPQTL